eukprot:11164240-Lingulodinium_polyedra.AAC.1
MSINFTLRNETRSTSREPVVVVVVTIVFGNIRFHARVTSFRSCQDSVSLVPRENQVFGDGE